jgi:hypothetical protein
VKLTATRLDGALAMLLVQCAAVLAACGDAVPPSDPQSEGSVSAPVAATAGASPIAPAPSLTAGRAAPAPLPTSSQAAGSAAPAPATPVRPPASVPPAAPAPAPAPTAGTPPAAPSTPPGPDDGDPSKPIVAIEGLACKSGGAARGFAGANFKVDNRDVIISYPCNKHEGAPMTFILNLHGTTPVAQHFYQEGYFSAAKYVVSHNLIIATPSSVVEQWGNGDDGKDLPYLMNVIDWVYKNLGTKFDIRSMWVGGHSWGAMYTSTFGCKPELADKVDGLIIMSGRPNNPSCANKMSVIDTNAEMDIAAPLNQADVPMQHGCKPPVMMMVGNNTQTLWPDCMPNYVHSNYLMLGKGHSNAMDDVVVKSIVDLIKSARP